jgi:hypothetical protein
MDTWVDYMGQSDNAPLLNMPLTTPPFPCDLNIVGVKKLFTKMSIILNVNIIFQRRI